MSALAKESLPVGFLNVVEETVWPTLREKLVPIAWSWFDNNKDRRVMTLFGVIPIYVGSYGIAQLAITELLGARPSTQVTQPAALDAASEASA